MIANAVVNFDFACIQCEYNLRGLPVGNRCPECGTPVLESLSAGDPVDLYDRIDALRRSAVEPVAQQLGCAVDGLLFVYDTLVWAAKMAQLSSQRFLSAAEIRDTLRNKTLGYFNDEAEASELLQEWGIRRSDDVGRMIDAMVSAGLIGEGVCDRGEAFVGLFTLQDLWNPRR